MKKMEEIAEQFNIKLSDTVKDTKILDEIKMSKSEFKERAFSVRDEIFLGEYKDKDIRYFSFLHELGHIEMGKRGSDKYPKLIQEIEAWAFAVGFHGQDIPLKAVEYILESLETSVERI
jgi:Zn-dependent peptidase ImmA (M78 family)